MNEEDLKEFLAYLAAGHAQPMTWREAKDLASCLRGADVDEALIESIERKARTGFQFDDDEIEAIGKGLDKFFPSTWNLHDRENDFSKMRDEFLAKVRQKEKDSEPLPMPLQPAQPSMTQHLTVTEYKRSVLELSDMKERFLAACEPAMQMLLADARAGFPLSSEKADQFDSWLREMVDAFAQITGIYHPTQEDEKWIRETVHRAQYPTASNPAEVARFEKNLRALLPTMFEYLRKSKQLEHADEVAEILREHVNRQQELIQRGLAVLESTREVIAAAPIAVSRFNQAAQHWLNDIGGRIP